MLSEILFLSVLIIVLYQIYNHVNQKYQYFEKRNIPFRKPIFLLGNSFKVLVKQATNYEFGLQLYNEFPNEK